MKKLDRDFIDQEVAGVWSHTERQVSCHDLIQGLYKSGIDLFFMSTTPKIDIGFKTYDSFNDLPEVPMRLPSCQTRIRPQRSLNKLLLLDHPVYGPVCYSKEHEELCRINNVDARYGCPLIFSQVIFCSIPCFGSRF